MPDNNLTDNEIIKEIQGIRESMKRHIDLTNEMGQDLLRIDEEYTGGSKVWLTTDYFKKVVTHFCHSNYLVKCMELIFEYINRLQAENKRLSTLAELGIKRAKDYRAMRDRALKAEAENERLKESNRLLINNPVLDWQDDLENKIKAEAYKEFAELLFEKAERRNPKKEEYHYVLADDIVDLLKELVGEKMSLKKSINILRTLSEDKQLNLDVRNAILQGESALKKQVPKVPDYEGDGYDDSGNLIYDKAYCPYCRHEFEVDYDTPNFCPECGQALNWSDTE